MIEVVVLAAAAVVLALIASAAFHYWLYRWIFRGTQELAVLNREQLKVSRHLAVSATEAMGKLLLALEALKDREEAIKAREEAAWEQKEAFSRYVMRLFKDMASGGPSNGHGNNRSKADNLRSVRNNQEKGSVVLHERAGFPG